MRMFAATLRRYRGGGSFEDLQQRLPGTPSPDTSRVSDGLSGTGDLVDLVDR